jgi:hypothetical protein
MNTRSTRRVRTKFKNLIKITILKTKDGSTIQLKAKHYNEKLYIVSEHCFDIVNVLS